MVVEARLWSRPVAFVAIIFAVSFRESYGGKQIWTLQCERYPVSGTMPTLEPIPRTVDVPSLPSVATDASTTPIITGGSYVDQLVVRMHSY